MPRITKEQIKLIQKATSASFLHESQSSTFKSGEGKGQIVVWGGSHYDANGEYHGNEIQARIDVKSFVYAYGRFTSRDEPKPQRLNALKAKAYDSVYLSEKVFQTALSAIKPGDDISLYWTADNNNELLEVNNLHADELRPQVHKKDKKGNIKTLEFLLSCRICLNNTARMIREA